jgi:hypothetical protein
LKPANVLLTAAGEPKIGDFGLAKLGDAPAFTASGVIVGTPKYMSPEQASGKSVGAAADIHALGMILYELLTGKAPFTTDEVSGGENEDQTSQLVLHKIINEKPVPPTKLNPLVPRELEKICLTCLQKSPDERYETAGQLSDDLCRFLSNKPVIGRARSIWKQTVKWAKKRLLVGSIVVLLGGFGLWSLSQPGMPSSAEKPPASYETIANDAAKMRQILSEVVAGNRGEDGWFQHGLQSGLPRLDGSCWPHAQALTALFATPELGEERLRQFLPSSQLLFEPGRGIKVNEFHYGWKTDKRKAYTQIEPTLWVASYLALSMRRAGCLREADLDNHRRWLIDTQVALRNFRPKAFQGGWTMFARQQDSTQISPYSTALALLALLEARASNLPWEGSKELRDELLKSTVEWLCTKYVDDPKEPGWRVGNPDRVLDFVGDGLTLQIFAELLRAEAETDITIPQSILNHIPHHLSQCVGRKIDHPLQSCNYEVTFTSHEQVKTTAQETIRFTWYPWAIECAARWLQRAERHGATSTDLNDVRRALAYLVVELGPHMVEKVKSGPTFEASETLYCLASLSLRKD